MHKILSAIVTEKLILGTAQLGMNYGINNRVGKPSESEALRILDLAYANGIRMLDTAEAYGNSIDVIGKFHKQSGTRFKIISKFILSEIQGIEAIEQNLERSLNALSVENLYCYMYHRCAELKSNSSALEILNRLRKAGKILNLGISVYTNEELRAVIDDEAISIIQLPFNLLDNENKRGQLINQAYKNGKIIHCRSVFLQGLFFINEKDLPQKLLPLQKYLLTIRKIGSDTNESLTSLALNYVLSKKEISGVLFGVEQAEQLQQNINAVKESFNKDIVSSINTIDVKETELLSPVNWK